MSDGEYKGVTMTRRVGGNRIGDEMTRQVDVNRYETKGGSRHMLI